MCCLFINIEFYFYNLHVQFHIAQVMVVCERKKNIHKKYICITLEWRENLQVVKKKKTEKNKLTLSHDYHMVIVKKKCWLSAKFLYVEKSIFTIDILPALLRIINKEQMIFL